MIAEKKAKIEATKAEIERQAEKRARIEAKKAEILAQYEKRMKKIELRKEIEAAAEHRKNNPVVKKPGLREVIAEINHKAEPVVFGDVFADVLSKVQPVKAKKAKREKNEEGVVKKPAKFREVAPKKKTSLRKKVA